MSQNYWRVLVDNLGMAYGITGDLQHAEVTLNYGVSQDPSYPPCSITISPVSPQSAKI